MIVHVVTDKLSKYGVDIVLAHVVSIRVDRLGLNSPTAYTISLSGGFAVRCDKENGERVRKALETFYDSPPPR